MVDKNFSTINLVDINNDVYTVDKGNVIRQEVLKIYEKSRCIFNYSYAGGKFTNINSIKFTYSIDSNIEIKSRYKNNLIIQIKIQYYNREYENEQEVFKDGIIQIVEIMPYTNAEIKGAYTEEIIDLEGNDIKSIDIIIINNEDGVISVNELGLFREDNIQSIIEQIQKQGLIIPLIDRIEVMDELPDGALCRCEWIEGVDY